MPSLIGVLSLFEVFANVDVNDKFAKHVANLIFGEVEVGSNIRISLFQKTSDNEADFSLSSSVLHTTLFISFAWTE
jgi:hypothetical protein